MIRDKKIIIGVALIAAFVFSVSFGTLYAQTHIIEGTACSCTLPIPLLIPTFSSLGVFIGSLVYYLMSFKIRANREKHTEDMFVILDMLNLEEKEIIKKIIKNNGRITQSKLSSIFGKVKTFRVLENLRKRGVIIKEKYGKTNIIKLNEKFEKIFIHD